MSAIDSALQANHEHGRLLYRVGLGRIPAKQLVVVTCMDSRIRVEELLGLASGDAHILRNAGAVVTDDVLRSLALSQHEMATREVMIIAHTGCGIQDLDDDAANAKYAAASARRPTHPVRFYGFSDVADHLRRQVEAVRHYPWVPTDTVVRGFVLDMETGILEEFRGEGLDSNSTQSSQVCV